MVITEAHASTGYGATAMRLETTCRTAPCNLQQMPTVTSWL